MSLFRNLLTRTDIGDNTKHLHAAKGMSVAVERKKSLNLWPGMGSKEIQGNLFLIYSEHSRSGPYLFSEPVKEFSKDSSEGYLNSS